MQELLETQNLKLCFYEKGDEARLANILMNKKTMRFWPQPFTEEKVKDWVDKAIMQYEQHGIGRLGIIQKATGILIGDCGFIRGVFDGEECWDLGIIIDYEYEGIGYPREALKAVVVYGFEVLRFDAIRVNTGVDNKVVCWLAKKLGMKKLRHFINTRNGNLEYVLFEMTIGDWKLLKSFFK